MPNIVQPYVPQILAHIWSSLKDARLVLRERAALLVSQCLQIHSASPGPTRDTKGRFQSYEKLLDEAKNGLIQMGNMEAVHGSMMVCQALFDHGEMVRALWLPSFLPATTSADAPTPSFLFRSRDSSWTCTMTKCAT